jgi:hypothetical protein
MPIRAHPRIQGLLTATPEPARPDEKRRLWKSWASPASPMG